MLRWKENLLEIKIVKYLKNILFRFCYFMREISETWTIRDCLKNIKLLQCEQIIHHFKARDLEIPNIYKI